MKRLFHIVLGEEWSRVREAYRPESLTREGFIHLSEREQVLKTANRFFRGRTGLVLLEIDATQLRVKYEEGEPGELFPHLYSELPIASVVRVVRLVADDDGTFRSFPGGEAPTGTE